MTTSTPVTYERLGSIATIRMDDGKANVMSEAMQTALAAAFDRAEADSAVVLLEGRPGLFSAGYDMAMFGRERGEIVRTIRAGGELVHRILGFPRPVVAACTGHAIAQGAFLLLAADVRVGAAGDFKIGLNEVAIGLTMPIYGVEIARQRLSARWFDHATTTGALYGPAEAERAGFLDAVVDPDELREAALSEAQRLTALDMEAHAGTKLRARREALAAMRAGIDAELSRATA